MRRVLLTVLLLPSVFFSSDKAPATRWHISGSLSEACSCSVPCRCNFGGKPAPHPYCYSMYSYKIAKGSHGDVSLDGLKFGSMDARYGRTVYIDNRANENQRAALNDIAAGLMGLKSTARFYPGQSMAHIATRYVAIQQDADDRSNHLKLGEDGEFRANYIIGRDGLHPVTVHNNTTWAIDVAIKATTSIFWYSYGRNRFRTKDTNSNQGEFEYDSTQYGSYDETAAPHCGRKPQ
jgi:hypothetical protein